MPDNRCRFCNTLLTDTVVDLGMSPLSNSYITADKLNAKENFYPLHVYVCSKCFLVQLEEYESPETIFSDYAYLSSFSDTWLSHAQQYVNNIQERFSINNKNLVIEIASNDGYLLQYFQEKDIPVLGIEPAENVAKIAIEKNIDTLIDFFGINLAAHLKNKGIEADLLLGNNVLAHVPDINDFVAGMKIILKKDGIITMEFPHLLNLLKQQQFDTIYHEHFSYLSFISVDKIFEKHGLKIFDVEELSTHGGSIRVYASHSDNEGYRLTENVNTMIKKEITYGIDNLEMYRGFTNRVSSVKFDLLELLITLKKEGKTIVGYGAPAKGNTFLNYCGIKQDLVDYTVDRNPYKQGKYLPGSHIPIFGPEKIMETQPDYVWILPWNLKNEIMEQMKFIQDWGGKFIIAIPKVEVI